MIFGGVVKCVSGIVGERFGVIMNDFGPFMNFWMGFFCPDNVEKSTEWERIFLLEGGRFNARVLENCILKHIVELVDLLFKCFLFYFLLNKQKKRVIMSGEVTSSPYVNLCDI